MVHCFSFLILAVKDRRLGRKIQYGLCLPRVDGLMYTMANKIMENHSR